MTTEPNSAQHSFIWDISKLALIVFVGSVLGSLVVLWTAIARTLTDHGPWWMAPGLVFTALFGAVMPLFFWALYRNQGTLRFSKRLRVLSLITALVFGVLVPLDVLSWIASFGPITRDPQTAIRIVSLLARISDLAYFLLLIAIFRQSGDEAFQSGDVSVSRLLIVVTKTALIVWGLWVAFNVVRVGLTPYTYSLSLQMGRKTPPLSGMMLDAIKMLLNQACFFVAPYIVYNSWLRRDETASSDFPADLPASLQGSS